MDGLLIIDKPAGITSHDVVSRVRRALGTKRVGHTGTLDPFATGVMVVVVGKATRLAQFLDKDEKEYEAVARFGFETDTGDNTGRLKAEGGGRNEEVVEGLRSANWDLVLTKFRGDIMQTPPMYSAKKVEGKKLYELARKGQEIERRPVPVNIRELELLDSEFRIPNSALRIRTVCSAGTYIRTLAEDIGREVGLGAHLTELRRTRAGRFTIDQSVKLDEVSSEGLLPIALAVEHLPEFVLREDRVSKTLNGMSTRDLSGTFVEGQQIRMTAPDGTLVAIGVFEDAEKVIQPKVVLG
ncbi:MAG TPA: tRNA pseudouridine(55) synthase TruB [Pyrinomonadaceae bacterium]|nr:tRNA pseudouridine(55) synthase TruB [Pyrinomonadaceae bacterium]